MRLLPSLLPVLFCAVMAGQTLPAQFVPLSAPQVQGTTLTVRDQNFSVTAPSSEWRWYERAGVGDSVHAYTAVHTSGKLVQIYVYDKLSSSMSVDSAREFVYGLSTGGDRRITAGPPSIGEADQPLERSFTFEMPATSPYGVGSWRGTIAARRKVYLIQTIDLTGDGLYIGDFVKSFRLLEQPPAMDPEVTTGATATFFACLIPVAIASFLNKKRPPRNALNGGKLAAVLVAIFAGVQTFIATMVVDTSAPAEMQGEAFGSMIGPATIPLIIALILAVQTERRRSLSPAKSASRSLQVSSIAIFVLSGFMPASVLTTGAHSFVRGYSAAAFVAAAWLFALALLIRYARGTPYAPKAPGVTTIAAA